MIEASTLRLVVETSMPTYPTGNALRRRLDTTVPVPRARRRAAPHGGNPRRPALPITQAV
jgi:hypothetical protein